RRHTRFSRDWSSDVCSSDLAGKNEIGAAVAKVEPAFLIEVSIVSRGEQVTALDGTGLLWIVEILEIEAIIHVDQPGLAGRKLGRSEERRVGNEASIWRVPAH